jgi:uncharacterized membrane protein
MRKLFSIVFSAVLLLIVSAQGTWAQHVKVWDLGTYPNGTWAQMIHINDSGVVVGFGDTPSGYGECTYPTRGYTRPVGVPLFGPRAGRWFDLGTFGGESCETIWESSNTAAAEISDTGLIVGYSPIPPIDLDHPVAHAFAWTAESGRIDLGTLEDLGYQSSFAIGVNKLGTLIVGWSGQTGGLSLPVVWTPEVVWHSHGPTRTWKIHALDTTGFEQIPNWNAYAVNDLGQIIGQGMSESGVIAVLWTPPPAGGKGWTIRQLDASPAYPNQCLNDINDRGEIVGWAAPADWSVFLAALWKPVGHNRKTWNLTVLETLPGMDVGSTAWGINDLGDIVGMSWDATFNPLAARWTTRDPGPVRRIGLPGDWSMAVKVNNNRIAAGMYGVGHNQSNPGRGVAVQLR